MKGPAKGKELASLRDESAEAVLVRERAHLALTLAQKQRELEADAEPAALAAIVVSDEDEYALVTQGRAEYRATRDELVSLRQAAAGPWKKVAAAIEDMFRPAIRAAEAVEADFKRKLDAFQLAKLQAERAARDRAAEAAQRDDTPAVLDALAESTALAQRSEGGRVAVKWVVERIAGDLLPDEWWCPDVEKIERFLKAHKGDDKPVIPGVIVREAVSVSVKR